MDEVRHRQRGEEHEIDACERLAQRQDQAPVVAVRQHAAPQRGQRHRQAHQEDHQSEEANGAGEVEDQPGHRQALDVLSTRHAETAEPVPAVVAELQRLEGRPALHVSGLLHGLKTTAISRELAVQMPA
jgi:hypothetical protein